MDTASAIREFLDRKHIRFNRSVEIVYRYHTSLKPGCRLNGCEMTMRSVGDEVIIRAEMPINVMARETRGVVRYLADLNKKRVGEGKNGYFDLDYVAGKIVFAIRVLPPITSALLDEVALYCVGEIVSESDDLLKVVCEECEAALQEEEELRQQQERERKKSSGSLFGRFWSLMEEIIGPGRSRKSRRRVVSDDDSYGEYMEFDYDFDDDEPSRYHHQARRPHSARPPRYGMEDEDETETYAPYEEPQPSANPAAEPEEEEDMEAPEWEPEPEEDEEGSSAMTDDEFLDFVNQHISRRADDDDVIYVPPTETLESGETPPEEPQSEEPRSEEAPGQTDEPKPESEKEEALEE